MNLVLILEENKNIIISIKEDNLKMQNFCNKKGYIKRE
jgi:hypothetical protein